MTTPSESRQKASELRCALIIPTYNNGKTVRGVVEAALEWCADIIVVDDGSTDSTTRALSALPAGVEVLRYADGRNRGKGYALRTGLRHALRRGFDYALTMDADGQHSPADIAALLAEEEAHPGSFIIGARDICADGMPARNTFANRFSNFWFHLFTLVRLSDTQSGFRLYPLREVGAMRFFTPRYEFEVEVAVRLAWRGVRVVNVPIGVRYPADRVSHFRPLPDFLRISLLNTVLLLAALLWHYPVCCWRWLRGGKWRGFLSRNLLHSGESASRMASGVAFGVMMSVMPIWGFQTAAAVGGAHLLRLNKIVVAAFANVSLPPVIPFVVLASLHLGCLLMGSEMPALPLPASPQEATICAASYALGAVALGAVLGAAAWPLAWIAIRMLRR